METDNRYRSAGRCGPSVMSVGDGAERLGDRGTAGRSRCALVGQGWRKSKNVE